MDRQAGVSLLLQGSLYLLQLAARSVGSVQMKHCSTAVEVEKQGHTEIVELPKVDKGCFKVWVAQQ